MHWKLRHSLKHESIPCIHHALLVLKHELIPCIHHAQPLIVLKHELIPCIHHALLVLKHESMLCFHHATKVTQCQFIQFCADIFVCVGEGGYSFYMSFTSSFIFIQTFCMVNKAVKLENVTSIVRQFFDFFRSFQCPSIYSYNDNYFKLQKKSP